MSAYIKLLTLEYPRYEGDIRLEHPEILESQTGNTFPLPDTYAPVQWVDAPQYDGQTQIAYEVEPVYNNGVWAMVWAVRNMTQEEIDFRNSLLNENSLPNLNQSGNQPDVIG